MKKTESFPTILSGRRFSADEILCLQETVRVFHRLSWHELLQTICEHLDWVTPAGRYKVDSCAKALIKLEGLGLVKLPAKQRCRGRKEKILVGEGTNPEVELVGTVRGCGPIRVEPVMGRGAMKLWNEYVERYHPLGYKRPFGAHQRYFIWSGSRHRLGCLLFASSAWALSVRDEWIGWSEGDRAQRLNWVIGNTRFLIFPWVHIRNLASKALSLVAGRIGQDWQQRYGYAPVLLETFVDVEHYRGTCYQAANWIRLGVTAGRGRMDRHTRYLSTPKAIYVYPLAGDFRSHLRGGETAIVRRSDGKAKRASQARRVEPIQGRKETSSAGATAASEGRGAETVRDCYPLERQE